MLGQRKGTTPEMLTEALKRAYVAQGLRSVYADLPAPAYEPAPVRRAAPMPPIVRLARVPYPFPDAGLPAGLVCSARLP